MSASNPVDFDSAKHMPILKSRTWDHKDMDLSYIDYCSIVLFFFNWDSTSIFNYYIIFLKSLYMIFLSNNIARETPSLCLSQIKEFPDGYKDLLLFGTEECNLILW